MVCWERFLQVWLITATACLLLLLLSTPIIRKLEIDRFHCDVTVGNVDGTLALGTFGYCLDVTVSNNKNKTCSFFLSESVIDNAQVFAQVKMVSTKLKILSIFNTVTVALVGELVGALVASCFAFSSLQRLTSYFVGLGVVFGLIGLGIDIAFKAIDRSVCHFGPGSYLFFSAFGILASLFTYYAVTEKVQENLRWSINPIKAWHGRGLYSKKTEERFKQAAEEAKTALPPANLVPYIPESSNNAIVQIPRRVGSDNSEYPLVNVGTEAGSSRGAMYSIANTTGSYGYRENTPSHKDSRLKDSAI